MQLTALMSEDYFCAANTLTIPYFAGLSVEELFFNFNSRARAHPPGILVTDSKSVLGYKQTFMGLNPRCSVSLTVRDDSSTRQDDAMC